jgi:hypothetical protein
MIVKTFISLLIYWVFLMFITMTNNPLVDSFISLKGWNYLEIKHLNSVNAALGVRLLTLPHTTCNGEINFVG